MILELLKKLDDRQDKMIEIRRHLHAHPELSFEEHETVQYILDFFKDKDCEVQSPVGGGGIVVTIRGAKPGPTVALRADFDALPIMEETNLPYQSQNPGVSHACGHDGHAAYMMVLSDCFIDLKEQLNGTIVVIFQHAEEKPPGGALAMIADGCLDGVDNFFSSHLINNLPISKVFFREKETQAARSVFQIALTGKGSHGSEPHNGNDAILAAAHLVVDLQTIVSRRVPPGEMAVVTVGSFDGVGSPNVIKEKVFLEGDVRCMKDDVATIIEQNFKQICEGISKTFGVQVDLTYNNDYPVLYNDPAMTQLAKAGVEKILKNVPEISEVLEREPVSASEDASQYLKIVPGCYFYVGARPTEREVFPHHNPKFDFNEKAMLIAAKAMVGVLANYYQWE